MLKRTNTVLKQLVLVAMKNNRPDTFQTVAALSNAEWASKDGKPGLLKDCGKRGVIAGSNLSLMDTANA